MLVCIDESGDAGFKFSSGSSEYFTCAAVIFTDTRSMDDCDRAIDEIRRQLKLPLRYEFHFTRCSDQIRTAFLRCVVQERFVFHGFVLNKPRLYGRKFHDKHGFYDFTVGVICENARELLRDAKVIIDKCGDANFRRQLERTLKARMTLEDGTCLLKKVTMEDSKSNNLVQLADMVCGSIARSFNSDREDRDKYRRILKPREARVRFWPK